MNITNEFRDQVMDALIQRNENFVGSDARFAKTWQINSAVYSQLKKARKTNNHAEYFGKLTDAKWIALGRALDVLTRRKKWSVVRTEVFEVIEEDILFCKEHSKARIFVDDCAIGKSFTAKYMAAHHQNVFYVDCSQAKTKGEFLRLIAMKIGVDHKGKLLDVADTIRYWLNSLERPLVILDEAGDLNQAAFLEVKGLWNATEGACGWYMMGADGLRAKIDRGFTNKKLGYAEIFSRFSEKYSSVVPSGKEDKRAFYTKLIHDVLYANMTPEQRQNELPQIVKRCVVNDARGRIGGLRRAESLLILHNNHTTSANGQSVNA